MKSVIHILHVFGKLNTGGAETMCMNLFRNTDRSVFQFDFIIHTEKHCTYNDEILKNGGKIYSAPAYRVYNTLSYYKWWDDFLKEHSEYQIIHSHFITAASVICFATHVNKRIFISHSHSETDGLGIKRVIKSILQFPLRYIADYWFACSLEAGKKRFGNQVINKSNFHVLYNAIDSKSFQYNETIRKKVRDNFRLPKSYKLLITVGRLTALKNPEGIIRLCLELKKRTNDWKLLWVGDGELRDQILDSIEKNNLNRNIIMAGVRRDVNELLQAADAFVLPSLWEGLPVAAIEAQAAGLNCFLSDTVSRDTDITGRCEFLPLNKWELWAKYIFDKNDKHVNTRQRIIEAGYDIEATSKWLQDFYLNVYKKRKNVLN